jgi:hypothetical protein
MLFRTSCRLSVWLAGAMLVGCGTPEPKPLVATGEDGLRELAELYKYLEYSKLPPPQRVEDLDNYLDSLHSALPKIRSGEYEVLWGVGLAAAHPAAGGVLAFEKKAAAEGGAVLLRDGTVKQMTVGEFSAARQAK